MRARWKQVRRAGVVGLHPFTGAEPVWVAEVTVSPAPGRPRPPADGWPVLARMYAPYRPRVGLVEQSPDTERKLPPYVLVRNDRAVRVVAGWCGADMTAAGDARA